MPRAVDRPGYEGGGVDALAAWFTEQRRRNPAFVAPQGYAWKGDHYERDTHGVWDDIGKWTAIGGGVGAAGLGGLGLAGLGPLAGGGAGGAAGTVAGGAGIPGGEIGEAIAGIGSNGAGGGGGGILGFLGNNWRDLLGIGGDIGSVLGGAASGAATGRNIEGDLLARRDLARNQQYGIQQGAQMQAGNLDLARKGFEEGARGTRAKQGLIGNLLQNIQDFNISVPGVQGATVTGGLRPSALGAGGRQMGAELARQSLMKMMTPEQYTGGELLTPPELAPIPEASGWETAAGVGGTIGSILGALGGRRPTQNARR